MMKQMQAIRKARLAASPITSPAAHVPRVMNTAETVNRIQPVKLNVQTVRGALAAS